jgi:hypothetical protein
MSSPILRQELTFGPDAASQNSYAYFPESLRGQYVEFTVYVQFSAGTSTGKIQLQTSFRPTNEPALASLVWANIGSTVDFAAASSQKYASVTGVFDLLRVAIDTAVTGGTVRAWVVAASHPG